MYKVEWSTGLFHRYHISYQFRLHEPKLGAFADTKEIAERQAERLKKRHPRSHIVIWEIRDAGILRK